MVKSSADSLSAEQKIAKILLELRHIIPFYATLYECIEKIETESTETVSVTQTKILYNKDFVEKTPYDELLFINLHEIIHIALLHVSRKQTRDRELWNIAADLYDNKFLAQEFSLHPGETRNGIKMPMGCLYCDSIDLDKECVEDIYNSFDKQAKLNGYYKKEPNKSYNFKYTGTNTNSPMNRFRTFEITIINNSKTYLDILDDGKDELEKESQAKELITNAHVRNKMRSTEIGNTSCKLEENITELLESKLDWRKLLNKYCIKALSTDLTFNTPDKRMYYQSAIYPGQSIDGSNILKGVKICIDSSGSISVEDIQYFYGQVKNLLHKYKLDAEVIYWDTEICNKGKFTDMSEFTNINLNGGGGTNPACLFKYFDTKKCKIKPMVSVIFTDGYIDIEDLNNPKWIKKYKDTIWVMTQYYNRQFEPYFGKIAIAKF